MSAEQQAMRCTSAADLAKWLRFCSGGGACKACAYYSDYGCKETLKLEAAQKLEDLAALVEQYRVSGLDRERLHHLREVET